MTELDDLLSAGSPCNKCCMDIDIDPMLLFFPERMDDAGREFFKAHGLDDARLADLRNGVIEMPDGKLKIIHRCQQLDELGFCRIYDTRPEICRNYDCSTRTGDAQCLRCTHDCSRT